MTSDAAPGYLSADGYSFPTNLDLDQPIDGLAPPTQAEGWRHGRRRPLMRVGCTRTRCSDSPSGHGSFPALMIGARSASVST